MIRDFRIQVFGNKINIQKSVAYIYCVYVVQKIFYIAYKLYELYIWNMGSFSDYEEKPRRRKKVINKFSYIK